jgi:ABC-type lipoprotein export system ATPase subunit
MTPEGDARSVVPGDAMTLALEIRELRFSYNGREPWVIDLAALELPRGHQRLLTARSGRGKSTLLHLVAGLMELAHGVVVVAGQPIHALRGAQRDQFRGRQIGMIFQTFNLLHGFTALENVMAALMFSAIPRKEHRARSRALLDHLGLERPEAHIEQLSIGQQQRVAVARAVVCDPVLVLADEPTASLDPENAETAMALIQQACRDKGAALLCVSHDPAMSARFEDRVSLDALCTLGRSPMGLGSTPEVFSRA